jgi:hypothetical protein
MVCRCLIFYSSQFYCAPETSESSCVSAHLLAEWGLTSEVIVNFLEVSNANLKLVKDKQK